MFKRYVYINLKADSCQTFFLEYNWFNSRFFVGDWMVLIIFECNDNSFNLRGKN